MGMQSKQAITAVGLLRLEAQQAYADLPESLNGVSEEEAWAIPTLGGAGYLHSEGSILGIIQHIATCKVMYASAAFRNVEIRWRDCADRLEELGADWKANLKYLQESQDYWLSSWAKLTDNELEGLRPTNWGEEWATWRILSTISHHDAYHAGQIALLRALVKPVTQPPPSHAATFRRVLRDHPTW